MRKKESLIILGGGGHASVIIDTLRQLKMDQELMIIDADPKKWNSKILDVPIVGSDDRIAELVKNGASFFIVGVGSVGNNQLRKKLFELGLRHDLKPFTVIHPTAVRSLRAEVGLGSVLLPGCIVNARAEIGINVIVNSGAIIEHDCILEDHVHVATGARLAGGVTVKTGSHIGIGATIRQQIIIGENAVVGAGSVVIKDINPHAIVAGNPAKIINYSIPEPFK